ncbi:hypothetical protein Lal_00033648, partial [Lupinus albus]
MKKIIFQGYKVGNDEADDTLLIGKNSTQNILVIKSILMCFELVFGLKINFHKSKFIWVNSDRDFILSAVNNLHCEIGSIPFKFLGIPVVSVGNEWMDEGLCRRLGSSREVSFWSDLWVRGCILKSSFARLYQVSIDKDVSVSSIGEWRNGVWTWNLSWRSLFLWEQEEYGKLIRFLGNYVPQFDVRDGWIWLHNKDGQYSVSNAYKVLAQEVKSVDLVVFKKLWKSNVPPKMKCLVYKIFLGRVPTKVCLAQRRVLEANVDIYCALCGEEKEVNFSSHMSLLCLKTKSLSKWISLWFIVIWTIWKVRNNIIFENSQFHFDE